ncbi:hypothetical protein VKT23_017486 [Stygiomarasmius scandens]|uniref:Uncharacterized protein n=1 Tax=Marasmiellus scandens TaxID=2682957 RepID=A0ABR1IW17_9AGAR
MTGDELAGLTIRADHSVLREGDAAEEIGDGDMVELQPAPEARERGPGKRAVRRPALWKTMDWIDGSDDEDDTSHDKTYAGKKPKTRK